MSISRLSSLPSGNSGAVTRLAWIAEDRETVLLLRQTILREAVRRRHKVLVLAQGLTPADQAALTIEGIESAPFTSVQDTGNPFTWLLARRRLTHILQQWRASAAVVEGPGILELGTRAAVQAGVGPIHVILPAMAPHASAAGIPPAWRRALMSAQTMFAATANDARSIAAAHNGTSPIAFHILPPVAVDIHAVACEPLPAIGQRLAFLAAIDPAQNSGSPMFVDAVRHLDGRVADARFVAVHLGEMEKSADDGTPPAHMQTRSVPLADPAALKAAIRDAHVVVVTGASAYQLTVLATALAVGRPVLAIDEPFNRDVIDAGANGWLAPQSNPAALAEAMAAILNRPDLLPAMARSARLKAERRLDLVNARNLFCSVLSLPDLRSAAA